MQCFVLESDTKDRSSFRKPAEFSYTSDMRERDISAHGDRPLPTVLYKGMTIPAGRFGFRDITKI